MLLLQFTTPKSPPDYSNLHHYHSHSSNALSFSSVLSSNSSFFIRLPVVSTSGCKTHHENPVSIACSSISHVHSYGTTDYERRPMISWTAIFKKISALEKNSDLGSASVLNDVENGGKRITKWELSRIAKELRRFGRYKLALEVYEWMNNRPERFRVTSSDYAIQLDLIAKVHGISSAEQYFQKLPEARKDKRIYGSLLNSYGRAKMKENAESLMDKMRDQKYLNHALPYNVMMTLYMSFKDHEKIELLISEMMEKGVTFDVVTYNIWLLSRGSQGSIEKMEHVFKQMEFNMAINPNWSTFSTMATIYIKSGHIEKAEECLREMESRITGQNRMPYHYLISHYGKLGKKEEVYRIWDTYKASFVFIPNLGYHAVISALVRMDDIEGAERIYDEWLTIKSQYDPRLGNLILGYYVRNGLSQKAETLFDQMMEMGGKPTAITWELLSEGHIRNKRISEALSCLKSAASADWPKSWMPRPNNVSKILEIIEEEGDVVSKDALLEILRQVGCFNDAAYVSYLPLSVNEKSIGRVSEMDDDDGRTFALVDELEESL